MYVVQLEGTRQKDIPHSRKSFDTKQQDDYFFSVSRLEGPGISTSRPFRSSILRLFLVLACYQRIVPFHCPREGGTETTPHSFFGSRISRSRRRNCVRFGFLRPRINRLISKFSTRLVSFLRFSSPFPPQVSKKSRCPSPSPHAKVDGREFSPAPRLLLPTANEGDLFLLMRRLFCSISL